LTQPCPISSSEFWNIGQYSKVNDVSQLGNNENEGISLNYFTGLDRSCFAARHKNAIFVAQNVVRVSLAGQKPDLKIKEYFYLYERVIRGKRGALAGIGLAGPFFRKLIKLSLVYERLTK
jgi:hypothetical protein